MRSAFTCVTCFHLRLALRFIILHHLRSGSALYEPVLLKGQKAAVPMEQCGACGKQPCRQQCLNQIVQYWTHLHVSCMANCCSTSLMHVLQIKNKPAQWPSRAKKVQHCSAQPL